MQTCTTEWRTSFLREVTPVLSKMCQLILVLSIDIGVTGVQGKAMETRKTIILTTKQQKNHYQITFKKKKFHVNSTEMYMAFACLLK